jgi:hypothetical protein|mmetsp:Transcript_9867/g.21916  ORF Transcript_9867/g.21916 Transcript_9867/m.21916 type:complete len:395 (+) Transcript_9867:221-1405(+)
MGNCINAASIPSSSSTVAPSSKYKRYTSISKCRHEKLSSAAFEASTEHNLETDGTASSATDQLSSTHSPPCSPLKETSSGDDCRDESNGSRHHHIDEDAWSSVHDSQDDIHSDDEHDSNSDDDDEKHNSTSRIEQQRNQGQDRLRELVITGANSGDIDWKSIISLAEDLHRKEQRLLRRYRGGSGRLRSLGGGILPFSSPTNNRGDDSRRGTSRGIISRKQAFFEQRRKRKENARRKKLESVGSFSVNLLLYGADESCLENALSSSCKTAVADSVILEEESGEDVEEQELEIYEDKSTDDESQSSQCEEYGSSEHLDRPTFPTQSTPTATEVALEGSFLAATSLLPSSTEEDSSSSSSDGCSTVSYNMTSFECSWDDDEDGLITIHEDASVKLW